MPQRIFGDITGYKIGSVFISRNELSQAGLHRPTQAGISGSGKEGADSIVLSGGYEDDKDYGDEIIYTGHGGRDDNTGQQIADQTLEKGNLALAYNKLHGLPVRVIRGFSHRSPYSPTSGYRYDGLYSVDDYWHETGKAGFKVWRFRLLKIPELPAAITAATITTATGGTIPPTQFPTQRQATTVLRTVRDTAKAKKN